MAVIAQGIDEAWAKADPLIAKEQGYTFVVGYVSQDTSGKNLTPDDVASIHAAGMDVGIVFEFNPGSALKGASQGVIDANIAIGKCHALNVPPMVAIYAAIDVQVAAGQMLAVLQYMLAFYATVIAAGFRCGAYADYDVCAYLWSNGFAGFLWQTYAWSAGRWFGPAVLRQTVNGIHVGNADVDRDESEVFDWGQWTPEGTVMPTNYAANAERYAWKLHIMDPEIDGIDDAGGQIIHSEFIDTVKRIDTTVAALSTSAGGLTDADRQAIKDLTDAINALNSRLATP